MIVETQLTPPTAKIKMGVYLGVMLALTVTHVLVSMPMEESPH